MGGDEVFCTDSRSSRWRGPVRGGPGRRRGGFVGDGSGADAGEGLEAEDLGGVGDVADGVLVGVGLDAAEGVVVLVEAGVAVVEFEADVGLGGVAEGDEGAEGVAWGVGEGLVEVVGAVGVGVEEADAGDGEVDALELAIELGDGAELGVGGEGKAAKECGESEVDGGGPEGGPAERNRHSGGAPYVRVCCESICSLSGSGWTCGFDDQHEAFDGADEDGGVEGEGGAGAGLPEFASDFDLACFVGSVDGADEGLPADHGGGAGEDLVAAGAEGDPGEAEGDDAESQAERRIAVAEVDLEFGDGGIDEGGEAEDESEDAGEGEGAVAGEFEFEEDKDGGGEEERTAVWRMGRRLRPKMPRRTRKVPRAPGTMVPGTLNSR